MVNLMEGRLFDVWYVCSEFKASIRSWGGAHGKTNTYHKRSPGPGHQK